MAAWSNLKTSLASSASSPASTTHTRHLSLTPSTQHRQIQMRRRLQQHKANAGNILRIQHQNKSDPSSSDDGMPPPIMHHRIATGIHMAHNKTIAPAGLISEAIEMQSFSASRPLVGSEKRALDYQDSVRTASTTASPITMSTDRGTIETSLSVSRADTVEKDDCYYKRSRSYHGKGFLTHSETLAVVKCCYIGRHLLYVSLLNSVYWTAVSDDSLWTL